jgi:hypothetical protein
MRLFTIAAALAIVAMFGGASVSHAQNVNCTGIVGGSAAATTIDGDVTVPSGASCTLQFVNVTGNVTVQPRGSLLIAAYLEPSTIGGNVQTANCASTLLEGNVTVKGNLQIVHCSGTASSGFQGPGIVIDGNFECLNNVGPCEAWLGQIAGNAHVQNNRGTASDVSLNTIEGNLQCEGNAPAPTHSHGYNWVTGNALGQCGAGFTTTSTSIGVPPSSGMACASLAFIPASAFPVPNTLITSATDTPAGGGLPERCIVNGYVNRHISPVDSCQYQDGFQVQLPLQNAWNGRFFLQGVNGDGGSVPAATGSNSGSSSTGANFGIINGYAVASEDGGHENSFLTACTAVNPSMFGNPSESFLDPMSLIDKSYQSAQGTTLTAKYLIAAYYGENAGHSYQIGCSGGGRQSMMLSQNFPQYFDGIAAGAPGMNLQNIELPEIWGIEHFLNVYKTASPPLVPPTPAYVPGPAPEAAEPLLYPAFPASDQALFETALLQACDALDGVADGMIDNLPACTATFDPATAIYVSGGVTYSLQCPEAKNATCLSSAQIQAMKQINQGPRTSTGQTIGAPSGAVVEDHADNTLLGYPYDGGYATTAGIPGRNVGTATTSPGNYGAGLRMFPYASISPPDPTYDVLTFNFDTDLDLLTQSTPFSTYATSLDISKFVNYGHKIIWYHGLSDPGINVLGTINYYNDMASQQGGLEAAQKFSRLYPIPNMGHCSGGAATDQFDLLTPLAQWVENGTPPGPIPATGVNFTAATYQVGFVSGAPDNAPTTRSRPLCPYPQQARFIGSKTVVNGVPVATNPADLANAANYKCIRLPPPYLE